MTHHPELDTYLNIVQHYNELSRTHETLITFGTCHSTFLTTASAHILPSKCFIVHQCIPPGLPNAVTNLKWYLKRQSLHSSKNKVALQPWSCIPCMGLCFCHSLFQLVEANTGVIVSFRKYANFYEMCLESKVLSPIWKWPEGRLVLILDSLL